MPIHESEGDEDQISPALLLEALAHNACLGAVMELFERPRTQKELTALLEVNGATMSRKMSVLEDVGLVTRERSHGPYSLVAPRETLELLRAAAELSVAAAGLQLETSTAWLGQLEGLNNSLDQQQ